jgi:Ca2+-binding RTX toxin-like protein
MAIFDGTPGDDTLIGTALADVISGFDGKDHLSGGLGNDKLDGGGNNDYLNGGADNDTLIGGAGNDILFGDTGNDSMVGGLGDDIYVIDSVGDKLTELVGQGQDVVLSSLVDYTLGANIEGLALGSTGVNGIGNTLNNTISGNNLGNKLDGGLGNDELYGDAGADTLLGGSGNDTLDGGFHADKMTGGLGNDTYVVNDAGDVVTELAGGGVDLVKTTVNGFMLGANLENLTLTGSADISGSGNDLANILVGNTGENILVGGKGNDTLDGGGDQDVLLGGLGNDVYVVDNPADIAHENAGEGWDAVISSVSYDLGKSSQIETLILSSAVDILGRGNIFDNIIAMVGAGAADLRGGGGNDVLNGGVNDDRLFGNDDNDTLTGGAGNDTLAGGAGEDSLNGGEGNDELFGDASDTLVGGAGDDTYRLSDEGDTIVELAGEGWDRVSSNLSKTVLSENVEELKLYGTAISGFGNALDNLIEGSSGSDNFLDGGAGNDRIDGYAGVDTLVGGAGDDVLWGEVMVGGAGNDIYAFMADEFVIMEDAGGGTDLARSVGDGYTLDANVENLEIATDLNIGGNGNELDNIITGHDGKNKLSGGLGDDIINGGKGDDTLIGGFGNDLFVVDSRFDVVQEAAGFGKDAVFSTVSYRLAEGQEIETLLLISDLAVSGDGNGLANTITTVGAGESTLSGNGGDDTMTGGDRNDILSGGNDNDVLAGGAGSDVLFGGFGNDKLNGGGENDFLVGGAGNDAMTGGTGDDHFYVEDPGDTVIELGGQGEDKVFSSLSHHNLSANIEDLQLITGGLNATGNGLANWMVGNAGANIFFGVAGSDRLFGEDGNDTLLGGSGLDILAGGLGADVLFGEGDGDAFRYKVDSTADLSALGNDTIRGFQTGLDVIELTGLLEQFAIDAGEAFSGGFVRLTASGSDTLVQFDRDGAAGASAALTLATVTSATVAAGDLLLDHYAVS